MTEVWKDVVGYEGLYRVSSEGRVKSLDRVRRNGSGSYLQKGRVVKLAVYPSGYWIARLSKDGKGHNHYVHRLVASAFLDNTRDCKYVDHIDGDKSNNCVENLRWCTAKENSNNPTTISHMCKYKLKGRNMVDIARENGIDQKLMQARMRMGWSKEDACTVRPSLGNRGFKCTG